MRGETFLAFTHEKEGPARNDTTRCRLETAVSYDIYAEIDEANGWKEDGGEPTADEHAALIEREAMTVREFFNFCTEGVVFDGAGRGMKKFVSRFIAVAAAISPKVLCGEQFTVMAEGTRGKKKEVWCDGRPLTLAQLATQPQVKMDPKQLRRLSDDFLKRIGLKLP